MSDLRTIDTEGLRQRLERGGDLQFWNVLTDEWFKGEMIPGSVRVPSDAVGQEASRRGVAKDAEIIVYCAGPKCPQSRIAAEKLGELGYTNVRAYEGGLEEWKAAGHEVEEVGAAAPATAGR